MYVIKTYIGKLFQKTFYKIKEKTTFFYFKFFIKKVSYIMNDII